MDKQTQVREELDEWLAEGKIDRETYEQLLAEQLGEPADNMTGGMFAGSASVVCAFALCIYIIARLWPDLVAIYRWSFGGMAVLGWLGIRMAGRSERAPLGRCFAIVASALWTLGFWCWMLNDFPPGYWYLSSLFGVLALGNLLLAYLSGSALIILPSCFWACFALFLYLVEWDDGSYRTGDFMVAFAALGALFLVAAREHVVLRWPVGGLAMRFARSYHLAGLSLINWTAFFLAWFGYDGAGYADVQRRLFCVSLTVIVYGLEVWAGQKSRMPWVSAMGVKHFLLQVWYILLYPYISLQQRALLVLSLALLLVLVAQGQSSRRSRKP